jgi:hypothetical protein
MKGSILRIVATVGLASSGGAYATTISFAGLSQAGSTYVSEGASYSQQGFTFTSGALYTWEAASANLPGLAAANTSLFEFYADGASSIKAVGNGAFTLNSIDLAPLIAGGSGTFDVTFTGTHADNSTVMQTFVVSDSTPSKLTTFDFSNFTNVVSVSFTQGTNSGFFAAQDTAYQFDNVVVNAAPTVSGVPEPRAWSLLALSVGAVLGLSRKRTLAALR